jgi:sulfide:quinone oxidoreductase
VATFRNLKTMEETTKNFDAMHVTPYMSPPDAIKNSPLADKTGFIDINKETLQHTKYPNVFALGPCSPIFKAKSAIILSPACPLLLFLSPSPLLPFSPCPFSLSPFQSRTGDCSNLPTSKTAAAIGSQAPVLVSNLVHQMKGGHSTSFKRTTRAHTHICTNTHAFAHTHTEELTAKYNGYTSCPIFVGNGKLVLAEFLYGGVVDETFPWDQVHSPYTLHPCASDQSQRQNADLIAVAVGISLGVANVLLKMQTSE